MLEEPKESQPITDVNANDTNEIPTLKPGNNYNELTII